jgi:hypothetical protein
MPEEIQTNSTPPTAEEIRGAISAMRDSVWVITDEMTKEVSKEVINTIERNVGHLELMMSKESITGSGEDLSDITAAINAGKSFMETNKNVEIATS